MHNDEDGPKQGDDPNKRGDGIDRSYANELLGNAIEAGLTALILSGNDERKW
jgi:hypothetical protein